MIDPRPVLFVIGILIAGLGAAMLLPMAADLTQGNDNWAAFAICGFLTMVSGAGMVLGCREARRPGLSIQQTFLLTTLTWVILPVFAGLPLMAGAPGASFTDAYFEAVSGLTTTGSTVLVGLEALPAGAQLWRGLLQWMGGIGIIVVAIAFLPSMKVGGMQYFRSEGFDTMGKILPRAAEIAGSVFWVYLLFTFVCMIAYEAVGMSFFDAIVHAMTTISTGGFANYDASFGVFQGRPEYVASVFMLLASLPFVRYVQIVAGTARPLMRDPQVRAFLGIVVALVGVVTAYRMISLGDAPEPAFREALFNITSIISGTGFASVDYMQWGTFPVALFFFIGLLGGCTGSTCCSIKIFRFQIALSAVRSQIRMIHSPHGVFVPRYDGRPVPRDVIDSVMAFFVLFGFTLAALAVVLGLLGLNTITAVSGAATALANVGPGLGTVIGPAGNFATLDAPVKWVLAAAMLIGRLEIFAVYVLFTARFWRD
ncbi:TrkH family potassium uptake protein [Paroceanicella profunda]|uniref:Trk system potassium uptake protein n=1 Tax=Paroceanicella profunda TaxID=2579971 RepID=A0A5B8G2G4_9RHOB|nr:TrkH family potassium uptake protein [Paroceanicella profunda]QDL92803.1 TrkH family potassium uptake protein [Paroceanicella profunda]